MTIARLVSITVIALAVGLGGCTINTSAPNTESPSESTPLEPPAGMELMGNEEARATMFAAMMIPHHQQAIDMSVDALEVTENAAIADLAQRIIDGQTPEIEQMNSWLETSRFSPDDLAGMPGVGQMGGMASEEELARLASLLGADYDDEFLRLMIIHHQGALQMNHMITSSSIPEVAQLARDIERVQTAEINEMESLRDQLPRS